MWKRQRETKEKRIISNKILSRNEANDIILENIERSINFDWVWLKELTPIDTNDSHYDSIESIKETLGNIYDELREVI